MADTSGTEDGRRKDGDTSNTNPFLHDLQPDDKLNAAAGVELARAPAEEHSDIRLTVSRLAFKLGDVADVLEFCLCFAEILTTFATQASEDVASLTFTSHLDEPTGGLGEEPDESEKGHKGSDLEANGESPREAGGTAFVEAAAVLDPVGDNDTEDVEGEFHGNKLSTRSVLRGLSSPDRNNGIEHTSAPTIDQAS